MNSASDRQDAQVRLAAFRWLEQQVDIHGDVLPFRLLSAGFEYEGRRVPLLSQQGIFKPAVLPSIPLSIRTAADGPYDDSFGPDGWLRYRYRGTDPMHRENVGLREAMKRRVPLIYLHGVVKAQYLVVWPVFVIGDQPDYLTFKIAVDDVRMAERSTASRNAGEVGVGEVDGRRIYITAEVRQRLHQRGFRERVLRAYREQCALCRLRQRALLDAAHIVPDKEPEGAPVVRNGLALCKIHHAAYDRLIIGIRPDYVVEVHPRVLVEDDGPMLRHGLQSVHQTRLSVPRSPADQPAPELLERRYAAFKKAA